MEGGNETTSGAEPHEREYNKFGVVKIGKINN